MNLTSEHKLFIVEFGKPDVGGYNLYMPINTLNTPVYVIAKSYDEAASKAIFFKEAELEKNPSVIGPDGSLNISPDGDHRNTIKAIKLVSDRLIM